MRGPSPLITACRLSLLLLTSPGPPGPSFSHSACLHCLHLGHRFKNHQPPKMHVTKAPVPDLHASRAVQEGACAGSCLRSQQRDFPSSIRAPTGDLPRASQGLLSTFFLQKKKERAEQCCKLREIRGTNASPFLCDNRSLGRVFELPWCCVIQPKSACL